MSAVDHEAAVAKLLADLGDTADAVADRLRALGIKGKRGDACCCILARFLHRDPNSRGVEICGLRTKNPAARLGGTSVPLPAPVAEFARRFDRGVYLDLIEVAA